MKTFLFILLLLLFNVVVLGQSILGKVDSTKLNLMFHDSTITGLTTTIEKFKKDKSSTIGNVWIKAEFNGPLSNKVYYHQLELALIVPLKIDGHDYWGELSYMLEILSQGDQIIFERLVDSKGEIKKIKFKEMQLIKFLKAYEQSYSTKVERNYTNLELYENDDFGIVCYLGGDLPAKGQEMMNLVNKKQSQKLMNWVKAISPLKKAYGVLGIFILTKKGLKLTEEQKKFIDLAKKETIEISTCVGCLSGTRKPLNDLLTNKSLNEIYKYVK